VHYKRHSYLLLIAVLLLMTGCRGGSKVLTQAEGFDFDEMRKSTCAIGGVVINTSLVPDGAAQKELLPFAEQWNTFAEFGSPMLYSGLLRAAPEMELWTFETVLSLVPTPELKEIFKDVERLRRPNPGNLKNISKHLPKVSHLVFARLDDTRLETDQDMISVALDQRNRDGRDPHANTLARTVTLRRGVYMSMEVYDLSTGNLVWSGEADQWTNDILSSGANKQSPDVELLREGEDSEVSQVLLDGTMRNSPGLIEGMEDLFAKLAFEMKAGTIKRSNNR